MQRIESDSSSMGCHAAPQLVLGAFWDILKDDCEGDQLHSCYCCFFFIDFGNHPQIQLYWKIIWSRFSLVSFCFCKTNMKTFTGSHNENLVTRFACYGHVTVSGNSCSPGRIFLVKVNFPDEVTSGVKHNQTVTRSINYRNFVRMRVKRDSWRIKQIGDIPVRHAKPGWVDCARFETCVIGSPFGNAEHSIIGRDD